jgi:hypothetical protein
MQPVAVLGVLTSAGQTLLLGLVCSVEQVGSAGMLAAGMVMFTPGAAAVEVHKSQGF